METPPWFATWFDSPYYHKLYSNRSDTEARAFIQRLVACVGLTEGQSVLDLACGKGRHAQALFEEGLSVTAVDLSPNSIARAQQDFSESIDFQVADMRSFELKQRFHAVFNLFTSFGYFDDTSDNQKVLDRVHAHLLPGGCVAVDFLNADKVIRNLVTEEVKEVDGTVFQLLRRATDTHIFKDIRFEAEGKAHHYTERVQALSAEHMEAMLENAGFAVTHKFGSYSLAPFTPAADRLIIIATKLH